MSITLRRIEAGSGFGRIMPCANLFESPARKADEEDRRSSSERSSSSSSSIGKNSDDGDASSDGGGCDGENEVQSPYKSALDMMDSLEQVLPIRRGISSFYAGKSKSFTTLADVVTTPSIKDIAKPENAYTRRRRNLLAINHVWDKTGRNKRPMNSSRSTLALAVAMSSSESLSSASEESSTTSSPRLLPPLHPQSKSANWRSFSVADMQQCVNTATAKSYSPFAKTDLYAS